MRVRASRAVLRAVPAVRRLDPGLPRVWIDLGKMEQVFINLLSNAAKFTEAGTVIMEIAVQKNEPGYSASHF